MRAVSNLRLVNHMAVLSGGHPRNSIAAIRECFDAGVERIEIDVHSLAGGDFIVSHDRRLEDHTTGAGAMGRVTPDDVRACRFRERPTDRPALLSEVVELARDAATEIQLDLKDWRPLSADRVRVFDDLVAPIRERVIVSSGQDWNLLRLHTGAPRIAFGFDPSLYLTHPAADPNARLPRTRSAYGYLDDHPLAFGRAAETPDYLRERFEMLLLQVTGGREFFLSYRFALLMLDDGFNAAEFLHERGVDANLWTPDYHGAGVAPADRAASGSRLRPRDDEHPAGMAARLRRKNVGRQALRGDAARTDDAAGSGAAVGASCGLRSTVQTRPTTPIANVHIDTTWGNVIQSLITYAGQFARASVRLPALPSQLSSRR